MMIDPSLSLTSETPVELAYNGYYFEASQSLNCRYSEGFFANCTVAMWNILDIARQFQSYPINLDFSGGFTAYQANPSSVSTPVDLYPIFFNLNLSSLPAISPLPTESIDHHGIYHDIDFKFYTNLVTSYFSPSERVTSISDRILAKYQIDLNKTIVVWYRGTDKRSEVWIASPMAYIKQAEILLTAYPEFKVWIQSEDEDVRNLFCKHFGDRCLIINELPPSTVGGNVHNLPEAESNIDRLEIGMMLLSLVTLAAKAKFVICHTGNISFWLCLYRGHTENVQQFDRDGILNGFTDSKKYWLALRSLYMRIKSKLIAKIHSSKK